MKKNRFFAALTAAVCAIGLCGTLSASAYTVYDQVYDPETGNTWHEGYETTKPLPEPLSSAKQTIEQYFKENAIPGEVVVYVQDGVSTLMVLCENSTNEDAVRAFVESSGIDPALIREVGTKAYPAGEDGAPMYTVYDQVYDPETGNTWHEGYETTKPLPEPLSSAKQTIEQYFKENAIPGEVVVYVQDGVSTLMVLCENSTNEDAVRAFVESSGIDPALIREVGTKAYPAGDGDSAPMYKVFDQGDLENWYETNKPLDHDLAGIKSMIEQFMQENGIPGEVGLCIERKTSSLVFSSLVVLCENSSDEDAVRAFLDDNIVSTLIYSVGTKAYNATATTMQREIKRYMNLQGITGYTYVKPDGRLAVICESFGIADQIKRFVDTREDYDTERIEYGVPTETTETVFNASTAARVLIASARIGAGQEPDENNPVLDVNGDAALNASDAANILQYAAYVGAGNEDSGMRNYMIRQIRENGLCQFSSMVQWELGQSTANPNESAAPFTKDKAIGKVRTLKGNYGDPLHFLLSPDDDLYTVKESTEVLLAVKADGETLVLQQNAYIEPMIYAARIGTDSFWNTYRRYDESLPEYEGELDESKAVPLTYNAAYIPYTPTTGKDGEANQTGMLRYIKLEAPEYAAVEIKDGRLDGWYLFKLAILEP